MKLSFTAVTASRFLSKAIRRTTPFSGRVSELVQSLQHPAWDIFQVVLHDKPPEYIAVGRISRGATGRLIQVTVGYPPTLTLKPPDDPAFVDASAQQISLAIRSLDADDALRTTMLASVEQARVETRTISTPSSSLGSKVRPAT